VDYNEIVDVCHWTSASTVACEVAAATLRDPLPAGTYWNINVPNLPYAALAGTRYTRQGRKSYAERLARGGGADGAVADSWVWANPLLGAGDDTDTAAVAAGYASLTPLRLDRTDDAVLGRYARNSLR
jgi:5'-nucleotidase